MFNMKVRLAASVIDHHASVLYRSAVLIKYHLQGARQ